MSRGVIAQLSDNIRRERVRAWNFEERFPSAEFRAIDLLIKLLRFDPRERITAEEALRHPFLAYVHQNWSALRKVRRFDFSFELISVFY
jgi:hypothetical protein